MALLFLVLESIVITIVAIVLNAYLYKHVISHFLEPVGLNIVGFMASMLIIIITIGNTPDTMTADVSANIPVDAFIIFGVLWLIRFVFSWLKKNNPNNR